jgi:pimeloyl-ACP methyl ester carboxylesterase
MTRGATAAGAQSVAPSAADSTPRYADLCVGGRGLRLEYAWVGDPEAAPLFVFLHEGLGSRAMWKDYPQALCRAAGVRGLVFSREGYGRSTPRAKGERWPVTFMHRQAHDVLPALFAHLGIAAPPWLFGHSDGGSIALLYASAFPAHAAGVVAVAPHVFVEDVAVRSIDATRTNFLTTDLRARLARYHDDPDSAFWGWNDVWLDPAFRAWNIEDALAGIACPVLAVQGEDDEYGTMAQVERIARAVPQACVVKLPGCGHSPQRDRPEALTAAVVAFLRERRGAALRAGDGLR